MNCPFEATLYYHKKANHWKFVVKNSSHNHHPSGSAAAHTSNRKLSARLYQEMNQLSDAGLKPARILEALKRLHPEKMILATITTIYSARKKTAAQSLRSLNPIIQLHEALPQSDYTTRTKVDKSGKIKGLFFCHNLSVQLLTHYHHILLLDCTYMTNKHKMPLLHIAGVTGANTSFSTAFCFLAEETQDFYDWALETFLTTRELAAPPRHERTSQSTIVLSMFPSHITLAKSAHNFIQITPVHFTHKINCHWYIP